MIGNLKLVIKRRFYDMLIEHAIKTRPYECVAILIGFSKDNIIYITTEVRIVNNDKKSTVKFGVNPEELYKIYQYCDKNNLEIVGIFHSHPTEAYPSKSDYENMLLNPYIWIITNMYTLETRAYKLINSKIQDVRLEIV